MKRYRVIPHHVNWATMRASLCAQPMELDEPSVGEHCKITVNGDDIEIDYIVENESLAELNGFACNRATRFKLQQELREHTLDTFRDYISRNTRKGFFERLFG